MAVTAVPDHVAIAVHDIDAAAKRWHDDLGGGWATGRLDQPRAPFATRQLSYANGARLELLQPLGEGFAQAFLDRFGPRIHHVTLKVDALLPAVDALRDEGLDVVDVFAQGDVWHEGFLRPSQVGGLIVQVAWAGRTDQEWARMLGATIEPPREDAVALAGPTLTHPDPEQAAEVWALLGGDVTMRGGAAMIAWAGSPLTVRIEPGPTAGPVGLRFAGLEPLAADDVAGPATLAG